MGWWYNNFTMTMPSDEDYELALELTDDGSVFGSCYKKPDNHILEYDEEPGMIDDLVETARSINQDIQKRIKATADSELIKRLENWSYVIRGTHGEGNDADLENGFVIRRYPGGKTTKKEYYYHTTYIEDLLDWMDEDDEDEESEGGDALYNALQSFITENGGGVLDKDVFQMIVDKGYSVSCGGSYDIYIDTEPDYGEEEVIDEIVTHARNEIQTFGAEDVGMSEEEFNGITSVDDMYEALEKHLGLERFDPNKKAGYVFSNAAKREAIRRGIISEDKTKDTTQESDTQNEEEGISNIVFFMHTDVVDKLSNSVENGRISFSDKDDFCIDEIEQPIHWAAQGKKDTIIITVDTRSEIKFSLFGGADLQMTIFSDGTNSNVQSSGLIDNPAETFLRYLYAGSAIRKDFAEKNLVSKFSDLDPDKEGILVELKGDTYEYTKVSGKDRPSMACYTENGLQMIRPYQDEQED